MSSTVAYFSTTGKHGRTRAGGTNGIALLALLALIFLGGGILSIAISPFDYPLRETPTSALTSEQPEVGAENDQVQMMVDQIEQNPHDFVNNWLIQQAHTRDAINMGLFLLVISGIILILCLILLIA